MTRETAISSALAYYDDRPKGYFADLARWVAVPTESQNPERVGVLGDYLENTIRPELEALYTWLRPQILVPVHGEVRHMTEQARLGLSRGIPQAVVQKNGDLVRLAPGKPGKITARWPGHMVHLDVKKVGRIPNGGGWRIHGRDSDQAKAAGRAKSAGAKRGYTYLHSAVDGFSRLSYTEPLPDVAVSSRIGPRGTV